jgi:hypothetical protein
MPVVSRRPAANAFSFVCLALLWPAGVAFGGIVPLPKNGLTPTAVTTVVANQSGRPTPTSMSSIAPVEPELDLSTDVAVTVPVVQIAPEHAQAIAPTAVPLPPAIETGISGGAALLLAAAARRVRRYLRRTF